MTELKKFNKVDIKKTCNNCVGFNGESWCQVYQCSTRAMNYGCKAHHTKEEWDKKVAELDKKLNSEKAIQLIATMPHDLNLFDKAFIDSFRIKNVL